MKNVLLALTMLFLGVAGFGQAQAQGKCTVIDFLPYLVDYPGHYCLDSDLTGPLGEGLIVIAADVVIDLNGFTLTGPDNGVGVGIYLGTGARQVIVRNGQLHDYQVGVLSIRNEGGHLLESLTIQNSSQAAIVVSGNNHIIRRNHIEHVADFPGGAAAPIVGISASGTKNQLIDNVIIDVTSSDESPAFGVRIDDASKTLLLGNRIVNVSSVAASAVGLSVSNSALTRIEQNALLNLAATGSVAIAGEDGNQSFCAGNYVAGYLEGINNCFDGGGNTVR